MKCIILVLSTVATVRAYANADFGNWSPAGKNDARGPCPVLNSLANHNLLPRNGRNLTVPVLVNTLSQSLNVSTEIATKLSLGGVSVSKNPASGKFDLDDLIRHNLIEHDASLSRKDFDLGGASQAFDAGTFKETLSFFKGASEIGIAEVAAARWGRVQSSLANNPKSMYGDKQYFNSYFESVSYFMLFKNAATNKARVDWIKVLFREFTWCVWS